MDLSTHVPLDYNLSQITIALTAGLCLLHRLLGLGGEHAVVGGRPSGPGQGAALTRALVAGAGPGLGGHWLILGLVLLKVINVGHVQVIIVHLGFTLAAASTGSCGWGWPR